MDRHARPQGVDGMIVLHVVGQRTGQNIEAIAVEDQPRHDVLELAGSNMGIDGPARGRAAPVASVTSGLGKRHR